LSSPPSRHSDCENNLLMGRHRLPSSLPTKRCNMSKVSLSVVLGTVALVAVAPWVAAQRTRPGMAQPRPMMPMVRPGVGTLQPGMFTPCAAAMLSRGSAVYSMPYGGYGMSMMPSGGYGSMSSGGYGSMSYGGYGMSTMPSGGYGSSSRASYAPSQANR